MSLTEQDVIDKGIKHGDEFRCPTCGAPGRIDLNPFNSIPEFELSVWWNSHKNTGSVRTVIGSRRNYERDVARYNK